MNHSAFMVAMFVIGNLVGSGFFMMPSILAPIGSNLLYSWAIACSLALIFAYIFGRLSVLFPDSNVLSDYFEHKGFKKFIAISYWVSCIFGNVGLLVVVVCNLNFFTPIINGTLVLLLLTLLNHYLSYECIEKMEIFLTILKFALLVFLPVLLFAMNPNIFSMPQANGSYNQVISIGVSSFWAFLGIETASIFGNGKSAQKGLMYGVVACCILYVLISLFIVGSISKEALIVSSSPFALLFSKAGISQNFSSFIIAFTSFGALYGWIAATAKMALFYSKSNVFPKQFLTQTNSNLSTLGLWGSSILSILLFYSVSSMNLAQQFDFVATVCVYFTLFLYIFCAYVLFASKEYKDKIISAIGITSVLVSFAVSFL